MSAKLRRATGTTAEAILHFCPGCGRAHTIYVSGTGETWEWDGNTDAPTVTPSVRFFLPAHDAEPERTLCHYFLKGGNIEYCRDSAHALAGETVPLPDWPYLNGTYYGAEC